jgi:hypothetical protein
LLVTQAPRQPDPPPPAQASGAADAPAWGKTPDPDQPAPQRVQPGQGPQGQQAEQQGHPQDPTGVARQMSAQEQAARFQAQAGLVQADLAAGADRQKARVAGQREASRDPGPASRRNEPARQSADPPPLAVRFNSLSRYV